MYFLYFLFIADTVNQSRRFQEACELMKKNSAKFLEDENTIESSSSEDELDDFTILQKTLSQYSGKYAYCFWLCKL